jgi:hypothetical protein
VPLHVPAKRELPAREKIAVLCPFHSDSTPSATVFLSGNGGFNCNGCQVKGNIFQFETRLSNCDPDTARKNIAEITGADMGAAGSIGRCVGVYDFRKGDGTMVFQKRRYQQPDGRKTFRIYRPEANGWRDGLTEDTPRVLYNLPHVITANLVLLAEGEKDCETLAQVSPWPERPDLRIATTTNFEGAWQPGQAPKWLDRYSTQLAGKVVIVFEDNDDAGRTWADHVCTSIHPFAESVRRITFHDMPAKSDVSDWMQQGRSVDELRKLITSAPLWNPPETGTRRMVFVDFPEFVTSTAEHIEWMVAGIIERGSNGFIAAPPKGSKSFVTADLAISLATGSPWLDFPISAPARVGLVSREDNPHLTAWRLRSLMSGKGLTVVQQQMLEKNLYVNSRAQTPSLMLDNEEEMTELLSVIKEKRLEFVILDVFNVLHAADENDNTEMRKVLNQCKRIQDESGAAIGILHHFNKETQGSITQRLRGASAISGFAEWMIGITMADEDTRVRRMEFELKAACPPEPIYFHIKAAEGEPAKISRVNCQPAAKQPDRGSRSQKGVN